MIAADGSLNLWRFTARLLAGAAVGAILVPVGAWAQAASSVETVVVTGTNIRGTAPVGEPIQNIDQAKIEATAAVSVQQLLETLSPDVNSFGSAGQTSGSYEPRIRSLGGSSSAATLVLVDGHRINPGGGVANTSDPNVVPAGAVESVQILADGASAVYGSDAVAGVINIITKKNYSGIELNVQDGLASNYQSEDAGLTFGNAWDDGGLLASFEYSHRSNLPAADRSFVSANQSNSGPGATNKGGANFNTFACSPATAIPATGQPGAGLVYAFPYSGTGVANVAGTNGLCSTIGFTDLLPETISQRLYVSAHQKLASWIEVSASATYVDNQQNSNVARGTVSNVTVYGPGSTPPGGVGQINPFFTGPAGVTQETVSYDFDQLLGPGAQSRSFQEGLMGTLGADIDLGNSWSSTLTFTVGDPKFVSESFGTVSATNAYQALNGSTVASGSTTSNLIGNALGTTTTGTRLPLTTANAFNPYATGAPGTSAAVLASLLNNQSASASSRPIMDAVAKVDGTLFTLPAGDVKVALGGEYYNIGSTSDLTSSTPIAGVTQTVAYIGHTVATTRHVLSAFAEVNAPLISEDMNIPLARKVVIDIAGRVDRYNDLAADIATTSNPKVGINWTPIEDLVARAAYGTSFVAPTVGATQLGTTTSTITSYFGIGDASFNLPQGYPNSAALGCPATGTCTVSSAAGKDGIVVFGGNAGLKPMTGIELSAGLDWTPKNLAIRN